MKFNTFKTTRLATILITICFFISGCKSNKNSFPEVIQVDDPEIQTPEVEEETVNLSLIETKIAISERNGIYELTINVIGEEKFDDNLEFEIAQTNVEQGKEISLIENGRQVQLFAAIPRFDQNLSFDLKVINTKDVEENSVLLIEVKLIGSIHGEIKSTLDEMVLANFNTVSNGDSGFLFSDQPTGNGIYEWNRDNNQGYANITAPIARFLALAGYLDAANLGFEEMYARTSVAPTDPSKFNAADLGTFLYAYELTSDNRFLQLATDMFDAATTKYPAGSPRAAYWAYDYYNLLWGATQAVKHGLVGANGYLEDITSDYLANIDGNKSDSFHGVYIDLIFKEFGIGETVDQNYSVIESGGTFTDYQNVAYLLMAQNIPDEEAVNYLLEEMSSIDRVSLEVAEAIAALSLFSQRALSN